MKNLSKKQLGFTLIELLTVIAVIGILAAVILTSLKSARTKGKDTKLKSEIAQLVTLAALNQSEYGSYCQLQPSLWVSLSGACSSVLNSGIYASKAQEICGEIIKESTDDPFFIPSSFAPGTLRLYSGVTPPSGGDCTTNFSFMTFLNNGKWYCSGSSGRKGEYANFTGQPGCYDNP